MKQKSVMGDFATVFGYYLKKEMRSKVYLIVTILLCVISLSSCFLLNLFTQEGDKQPLYVVDQTGMFQSSMETAELPKDYFEDITLDFSEKQDITKAQITTGVKEDEKAYAVLTEEGGSVTLTVYDSGSVSTADAQALLNLVQGVYQQQNLEQSKLTPEEVATVTRQVAFRAVNPVQESENFWSTYILYMLMTIAIVMYSCASGNEVAYLKTNKVMEVVTTSIKPLPFYLGVTLSIGLTGLIQLVGIVVCFVASYQLSGVDLSSLSSLGVTLSPLQPHEIAAFLLLFLGGFLLYSFINTAIASIVNSNDDLTTTLVPVEMLAMVQFFVSIFALQADSTLTMACSYIPFTSPAVMFVRYMIGFAGVGELALSLVILYAAVAVLAVLGARLFSRGVVHYGTMKAFKWKRA